MNWPGIYKARILIRVDPNKQHRIKVNCPQVYGSLAEEELPWAYPAGMPAMAPGEGSPFDGAGEMHIPPIGSPVWVMFEGGDPNFPVWLQGWWANPKLSTVHPPEHAFDTEGNPDNRYFTTPRGTTVQLDDRKGIEKILLRTPEGDYMVIDAQARSIDIWAESSVRIRSTNKVEIMAETAIVRTSGDTVVEAEGEIDVHAGGDVNITSDGDINLDAAGNINWNSGTAPPPPAIKIDTDPSQDGK